MMVKMLGVSEDGDDGYEVNGQPSQEQSYMHQFLLFFLLILNVQISQFCFSSHCECANLQSPSFVRDPINSGSEASLGAKTSHT